MNEPKKRGRPAKAKPCPSCGQTVGHYDDCEVGMGVVLMTAEQAAEDAMNGMRVMLSTAQAEKEVAQAYALRVWKGCSVSLYPSEKEQIVKQALEGQGWSMEGIELPR